MEDPIQSGGNWHRPPSQTESATSFSWVRRVVWRRQGISVTHNNHPSVDSDFWFKGDGVKVNVGINVGGVTGGELLPRPEPTPGHELLILELPPWWQPWRQKYHQDQNHQNIQNHWDQNHPQPQDWWRSQQHEASQSWTSCFSKGRSCRALWRTYMCYPEGRGSTRARETVTTTIERHPVKSRAVCPSPHPLSLFPTPGKLDRE